ncbi:MAG: GntR family transcriptional regulator [Ruminococcus sp.]|nr:GntR family transcriptional regulator [Ruminococcus sp.]
MGANYPSFNDTEPLYIQIAQWLEDKIVTGQLGTDEQIPSTTELSQRLRINPATVRKGVNILVDKGLVYKKRGMGMYVAENANKNVRDDRRVKFYDDYIKPLIAEAERLGISPEDIIEMLKGGDGK